MIDWDRLRPLRQGDKINYTDEHGKVHNCTFKRILTEDDCVIEIDGFLQTVKRKWICYGWRNLSNEVRI